MLLRLGPGSEDAWVGAWPWMASAGYYTSGGQRNQKWTHKVGENCRTFKENSSIFSPSLQCGGTVISNYHVLTAAHCADEVGADRLVLSLSLLSTSLSLFLSLSPSLSLQSLLAVSAGR